MVIGPLLTVFGIVALIAVAGIPLSGVGWLVGFLLALFLLWRGSLLFGPKKKCWRCEGSGHVSGALGGYRQCVTCGGSGYRDRVGGGDEPR